MKLIEMYKDIPIGKIILSKTVPSKLIFAKSATKKSKYLKTKSIDKEINNPKDKYFFDEVLFFEIKFPIKQVCKTVNTNNEHKRRFQ